MTSKPHISLDAIRQRVDAAEQDGWYGYDEEARADVRWLLEQLEAAHKRISELSDSLDALGWGPANQPDPLLDERAWYDVEGKFDREGYRAYVAESNPASRPS